MTDLIKRDDAMAALTLGDTMTVLQNRIRAIPAVDPAAIREDALREAWKAVNKVFNGFPNHASDAVLALIGEKK